MYNPIAYPLCLYFATWETDYILYEHEMVTEVLKKIHQLAVSQTRQPTRTTSIVMRKNYVNFRLAQYTYMS